MTQAAAIMKNGRRLSNSWMRTTFAGRRFNSIAQQMRRSPELFNGHRASHRHIAHWIKRLDGQLQFLLKKFAHVRHTRASAAKENALRRTSLLLRTVMADGTHQLCVQPRHRTANYL